MEEIKVNKTDLLAAYSSSNKQQKEILENSIRERTICG